MNATEIIGEVLGGAIVILPFGLAFGLVPPLAVALSNRLTGSRWLIPASRDRYEAKVPYFILGLFGGIGGAFLAFATLAGALEWECYAHKFGCNDGQGGIALIFTVPIISVVCSALALCWTALSFRIREESVWASVFRYSGERRLVNWVCAISIQIVHWVSFAAIVFRMMLATF
jgi:hypothetical protein